MALITIQKGSGTITIDDKNLPTYQAAGWQPVQKATLFGPNGTKQVVDVGSSQASQLQSQGWGLNSYTPPAPVTSPPTSTSGIPFKAGLSAGQQASINDMVLKRPDPSTWNATDKANWDYATNYAAPPTFSASNISSTPSNPATTPTDTLSTPNNPDTTPTDSQVYASRYGLENDEDANWLGSTMLNGLLDIIQSNPQTGISSSTLDAIKNNKDVMTKYLTSMAYGDYTMEDIYRDIKRQDLVFKGDSSLANVTVISPTESRGTFANTPAGKTAFSNPSLSMPSNLQGISNPRIMQLKLGAMPDWAFTELTPTLDVGSDEFKKELETIKDAYHDVLMAQMNATTEREKAIADYQYEELKKTVEENYNLRLSDNALNAWDQIENMGEQLAGRGLAGSGLADKEMTDYLKRVRENDRRVREQNIKEEDSQEANKYSSSASASEIQALIEEDKAKGLPQEEWRATKWGFIPSAEALSSLDVNRLMQEYGIDEETAKRYRAGVIDENGNYRSTLYQNQYNKMQELETAKLGFQTEQLLNKNLKEEQDKYWEVSSSLDNPFSSHKPDGAKEVTEKDIPNSGQYSGSSSGQSSGTSNDLPGDTSKTVDVPKIPEDTSKTSTWKPSAGYSQVYNPDDLNNYRSDQIERDPNSDKIYVNAAKTAGDISKNISGGSTTPAVITSTSGVPDGYQQVRDPNNWKAGVKAKAYTADNTYKDASGKLYAKTLYTI